MSRRGSSSGPSFAVGDLVEARYATHPVEGKLDKYYRAVVHKVFCESNSRQTHVDLEYEDGDKGAQVDIKHVRPLPPSISVPATSVPFPPPQPASQPPASSDDEEELEDGAVDWKSEGRTSGHPFINQRVALLHDTGIAKGTVTMWVPANDEKSDEPALFHVSHDDGDSEDLEEDEVEEAVALLKAEEEEKATAGTSKQRGKRKVEEEMSAKQRGKRKHHAAAAEEEEDDEDDVAIVGASGDFALSDFPHSREHCTQFKFGSGAQKQQHCENCFCLVCGP
jgi:hypothetical protein